MAAVQDKLEQLATLVGRRTLFAIIGIVAAIVAGVLISQNLLIVAAGVLLLVGLMAVVLSPDIATVMVTFIVYSNVAVVAVRFHGAPYILGAVVPLLLVFPVMTTCTAVETSSSCQPRCWHCLPAGAACQRAVLGQCHVAQAKLMTFISEGLLLLCWSPTRSAPRRRCGMSSGRCSRQVSCSRSSHSTSRSRGRLTATTGASPRRRARLQHR